MLKFCASTGLSIVVSWFSHVISIVGRGTRTTATEKRRSTTSSHGSVIAGCLNPTEFFEEQKPRHAQIIGLSSPLLLSSYHSPNTESLSRLVWMWIAFSQTPLSLSCTL